MMPARALPGTDTALPCTCSIGTDQENKGTSSGNKISISTPCCRGVCNVKHLKKLFSMSAITAVTNCAVANCSEGCYAHWPPPPPPASWALAAAEQSPVISQLSIVWKILSKIVVRPGLVLCDALCHAMLLRGSGSQCALQLHAAEVGAGQNLTCITSKGTTRDNTAAGSV